MSLFDGKRLDADVFKLDVERARNGWYSDKYFVTIGAILGALAEEGYRLRSPRGEVDVGDIHVEMQFFTRRRPFSVIAGTDKALAVLRLCSGHRGPGGEWVPGWPELDVEAIQDGETVEYDGDPLNVTPVLRVRGRYRDFAVLETPILGCLTRCTRIATNVFRAVSAAGGKEVLFFPARFDAHEVQAGDGYSYQIGVRAYNHWARKQVPPRVSTDAQGDWWGADGGGTVAHSAIACFMGDIVEAMLCFARTRPPSIPRIALVDFTNDCVGETLRLMRVMFREWACRMAEGDAEGASRYRLAAVRADTASSMRDVSVVPLGDPALDNGVCPRLIHNMRAAMDAAHQSWDIPEAWRAWAPEWCRSVKIVATGGFTPEKISLFERQGVPVDIYGVGSSLLWSHECDGSVSDYTADVVRVKVGAEWTPMAKVGRQACDNPRLVRIEP